MPFLFEGFVISELIKAGVQPEHIKFWRTKNRQEVDVLLDTGGVLKPVEIKYKRRLKTSDFRGLHNFKAAYPEPDSLFLVNLGSNRSQESGVKLLSPFELDQIVG